MARAEIGTAEGLADRRLLGLQLRRLAQRHRRLIEVAGLEQRGPALEQVVDVVHAHPV
jgi:hypothetical protein